MKNIIAFLLMPTLAWAGNTVFTSPELGLTFEHPDNWQVATKKGDTRIRIPLSDGSSAQLLVFPRSFNGSIDVWNSVERDIAAQQKHKVDAQTQEQLLGVPLLLTRIKYTESGRAMQALSGLVYSATPRKLLFRLVAPDADFDQAEQILRTALTTLRTTSGKLPAAESPDRKVTPEDIQAAQGKPETETVITAKEPKNVVKRKGPVVVSTFAAGRKLSLRLPAGWTGQSRSDGSIVLRNSDLSGPLTVSVLSSLDGDFPATALDKVAAASLSTYTLVQKRLDYPAAPNDAGAVVSSVWRWGDANGKVVECDAVGVVGDYYWLFGYRCGFPVPGTKDIKAIQELMKTMSVELAP